MANPLERFALSYNPFEPSGSGSPLGNPEPWIPSSWQKKLNDYFAQLGGGDGIKPLAVVGEYGSGKSYLLQWLAQHEFPRRRVQSYYFNDPGVQFYDLVNQLLRRIGRKHFSKLVWELAHEHVKQHQLTLFRGTYEDYLAGARRQDRAALANEIQQAVRDAGITEDEEIAHCLARIVVDTPTKTYFEHRDFLPGGGKSLVAEREGAKYFGAILRTLRLAAGVERVAFLIDEFEEISLRRNISTAAAQDYRVTLKRLIDLTRAGELWLVLSLTLDGKRKTEQLDPAFWERMFEFSIPPLSDVEAKELVAHRLKAARSENANPKHDLFPFDDNFIESLRPDTRSKPRWIIKTCFAALNQAVQEKKKSVPNEIVQRVEQNLIMLNQGAQT